MSAAIVNNRIAGTRITVWDVYHYLEAGDWSHQEIADILRVSLEEIQATVKYIDEHRDYVLEVHRQIEERNARGNSPEVLAKLEGVRARMQAWLEERRRAKNQEKDGAGNSRGC